MTLTEDDRTIAASLLWLLRGDAGQRALAAWSMGWQPAQQASGTSWMGLYLSILLEDPHDAVRFVAYRSFRSLPGLTDFEDDFAPAAKDRVSHTQRARQSWQRTRGLADRRTDAQLLLDNQGSPKVDEVSRLGRQRDDRPVVLGE